MKNHILIHFNFIQLLNKIRIISKKLNKYFINFISTTHHHHHYNNNNNNNLIPIISIKINENKINHSPLWIFNIKNIEIKFICTFNINKIKSFFFFLY